MTSIDKVSVALSEWVFNVAKSVLPKVGIPTESAVGKFMYGILGVNPATYNVWNELGFLAEPMIQTMVTPMVGKYLQGIPDEQVQDVVMKFADAFVKQAQEKKPEEQPQREQRGFAPRQQHEGGSGFQRSEGFRSAGGDFRRGGSRFGNAGTNASFEDKLSRFLKDSDERLTDLSRKTDSKRGGRGGGRRR